MVLPYDPVTNTWPPEVLRDDRAKCRSAPNAATSGSIEAIVWGMAVLRLDDVLAEVMKCTADDGIRIIGVDGPQGSGKSTLATRISARIGAPLVQMDDFVSWVDLVGWWPRFEA